MLLFHDSSKGSSLRPEGKVVHHGDTRAFPLTIMGAPSQILFSLLLSGDPVAYVEWTVEDCNSVRLELRGIKLEANSTASEGRSGVSPSNSLEQSKDLELLAKMQSNDQEFKGREMRIELISQAYLRARSVVQVHPGPVVGRAGSAAATLAIARSSAFIQGGTHDSFEGNAGYLHVDCLLGLCRRCHRPRPRHLFAPHHAPGHSRPTGCSVIDEGGSDRGGPPHPADRRGSVLFKRLRAKGNSGDRHF